MDETFHLTPLDVRRYDFGRALRGYDPERVEQFRTQVAGEMERLARQALELEQKAKGFHEQLRAFRERDKALNDALVSAQQLRAEIRDSSEREASLIVREARAEAERETEGARNDIRKLEAQIAELERSRRNYLAQLRVAVERQLVEITAQENAVVAPTAPRAAAAPASQPPPTLPPAPRPPALQPQAAQPEASQPPAVQAPVVAPTTDTAPRAIAPAAPRQG